MNIFTKELLISILIILLFYLIIKRNNVIIMKPSKDQMDNVSYYADDINDIDFSFKENLENNTQEKSDDSN
jgi:hypothetical protein